MLRLHFVYVAFSTVVKLIGAVIPGTVVSHFLSEPIKSEQGFSFITLRVFLSCMLFANLCMDVSPSLLREYFWAVLMSLIPMVLGIISSLLVRKMLPNEWRVLLVLGSTFQNGLAFPLSVVTNIKGIPWLDRRGVLVCQQYVFLYNLTCAVGLWSIGSLMVKHYKDKLIEKHEAEVEEEYFQECNERASAALQQKIAMSEQKELRDLSTKGESHPAGEGSIGDVSLDGARSRVKSPKVESTSHHLQRSSSHTSSRGSGAQTPEFDLFIRVPTELISVSSASPLTASSSPHQCLEWYRPSRRTARPIDVRKFRKYVESPRCDEASLSDLKEMRSRRGQRVRSEGHPLSLTSSPQALERGRQVPRFSSSSSSFSSKSSTESTRRDEQMGDSPSRSRTQCITTNGFTCAKSVAETTSNDEVGPIAPSRPCTTEKMPQEKKGNDEDAVLQPVNLVEATVTSESNVPEPRIEVHASDLELHFRDRSFGYQMSHVWEMVKFVLQTPPITLSIIGIAVALIPPLRWLGSTAFGAAVIRGFELIGTGCVPVQLVTLGIILSPNNIKVDTNVVPPPGMNDPGGEEEERRATEERDALAAQHFHFLASLILPFRWLRKMWQGISPAVRLSILCLSLRLLILPSFAFFIVHWLVKTGIMPSDRLFVVSILIGVSSPAAVNASLVCTMHGYYPRQFAKMILTMYCVAAITSTFWISVSITYANQM